VKRGNQRRGKERNLHHTGGQKILNPVNPKGYYWSERKLPLPSR
jgi:hypothetical protein